MNEWHILLDPAVRDFIAMHQKSDVAALALQKPPVTDWPYKLILNQIKSRQKATLKIPSWINIPGIIFPAPDVIEQASSQATARYKASCVEGKTYIDLTAGSGIDSAAIMGRFSSGIAVEKEPETAAILQHNLVSCLKLPIDIQCGTAEDMLQHCAAVDLIYIDPQRRDSQRRGLFKLAEASPDITTLLPLLRKKAKQILIKTSPLLDIDHAIETLKYVDQVHIVEWRGECREVLYLMNTDQRSEAAAAPILHAVSIDDQGAPIRSLCFTREDERAALVEYQNPSVYLYEPSAAFTKAGAYRFLAARFGLHKLHPHTHLYTSTELCPDFPGRIFQIYGIYPASGKGLPVTQASITVRNFPAEAATLMKKLGLKDGGDDTLMACTLMDGQKALIHVRKTS